MNSGFKSASTVLLVLSLLSSWLSAGAQTSIHLDEAIDIALQNNLRIRSSSLETERRQQLRKAATEIPKTEIHLTHGQYNSIVKNDNNLTITQTLPFPTLFFQQAALEKARVTSQEMQREATLNAVVHEVSSVYIQLLYVEARYQLLLELDSLLQGLVRAATIRLETGEAALLEKIAAETEWNETKNKLRQTEADQDIYTSQLSVLLNNPEPFATTGTLAELPGSPGTNTRQNPLLLYFGQQVKVAEREKKAEAAMALPDITLGFFSQTLIGYQLIDGQEQYFDSSERFEGFTVGLSIPIWFVPNRARVKAASYHEDIARNDYDTYKQSLEGQYDQAMQEYEKTLASLHYYNDYAVPNAKKMATQNWLAFQGGEIDYSTHLMNLRTAIGIREGQLTALRDHHLAIVRLNYLNGNADIYEK